MIKIGITGQAGFLGSHVYNTLGLFPEEIIRVPFHDEYFEKEDKLKEFVSQCDVVVHLAAMNRHPDPQIIYSTNIQLVKKLIAALEAVKVNPHVIFSSSTQEERDNEYGRSKREGRLMFEKWAQSSGASFSGLLIPNVFGPFGKPNYNSFIATFCDKLVNNEQPNILQDSQVNLIYSGSLCSYIIQKIKQVKSFQAPVIELIHVPSDFEKKVTEVLALLCLYKDQYLLRGNIPYLSDRNEVNLFNTFRSFIKYKTHFPIELILHADTRGVFVETIKLGVGGQISFSTTVSGITRGNHYHTRKIERFTVIKGKARIQIRKIGSNEVISYDLDGAKPAYVDMPVWYTHNITNTGTEDLYTQFWINEWFDPSDGDTYFEIV